MDGNEHDERENSYGGKFSQHPAPISRWSGYAIGFVTEKLSQELRDYTKASIKRVRNAIERVRS